MRISDWSSDVCSSDLRSGVRAMALSEMAARKAKATGKAYSLADYDGLSLFVTDKGGKSWHFRYYWAGKPARISLGTRSEEHTSELQSLMRISYAVFCLKKKKQTNKNTQIISGSVQT